MEESLFVEKYRPKKVKDVIMPKPLTDIFQSMVDAGSIPNLILNGSSGVGKTSMAYALCEELGYEVLFINGSIQGRQIDTIRNVVTDHASTVSFSGKQKVVIFDEADNMTADMVQPALKGFIEKYHKNCRFIFTCNSKHRIIPAIHSRCKIIDFEIKKKEKPAMAQRFFKRLIEILTDEGVAFSDDVLVALITKHFPDFRRVLNEIQSYASSGSIDEGILVNLADIDMDRFRTAMKAKDFNGMCAWVVDNIECEPATLFRKIYDNLRDHLEPTSIPPATIILAEYQYKSAFTPDQELNFIACLTNMMLDLEYK